MGTIPAATPTLTRSHIERLKDAGLDQMAMSLDFPRPGLHDDFRRAPGAFRKTMQAIEWAHDVQLPVQINTSVFAESAAYLSEMARQETRDRLLASVLSGAGRPQRKRQWAHGATVRGAFKVLYRAHTHGPFIVKVTEAPHYRRFVVQREQAESDHSPGSARR